MWAAQGGVSKRSSRLRRATWGWTSTRPAPGRAGITTWLCVCWAAFLLSLQQAWGEGVDLRFAAMSTSTFALAQIPASLFWAALARRVPIRFLMMGAAFVVALAAAGTVISDWLLPEIISAAGVGFGVGGLQLLIRLVWADYYGRQNLGTIRGLTMSVQVGGQALGPVIAGFMFDYFDSYQIPFTFFAVAVFMAGIMVLAAKPPPAPTPAPPREPAGVSG